MISYIPFFIIYQLIQIIAFPFIILFILLRKLKGKPIFGSLKERLGFVPINKQRKKTTVWIHAVSVGEILSIQHIVEKIKKQNKNVICYITTGTLSGKKIAQKKLAADHISFLPYDFLIPILIAFYRIRPTSIIIVEAELWSNFLMLAKFKQIPSYLLNARVNKKSQERYKRFRIFLAPLFNLFDTIYTQSEYDKKQLEKLGVQIEKLVVLGNIKTRNVLAQMGKKDSSVRTHSTTLRANAFLLEKTIIKNKKSFLCVRPERSRMGTNANVKTPTLLVGSIHPGELDTYLELFIKTKVKHPDLRIILAPRHFHWKKELIQKIKQTGFTYNVWDEKNSASPDNFGDILLVCKLGELFDLYKYSDIFFLGGTFIPVGGHNLLEPAVWAKPSIIGPHDSNCHVIADELKKYNALIQVKNVEKLIQATDRLLANPNQAKNMGYNAKAWLTSEATLIEKHIDSIVKKVTAVKQNL